MQNFIYVYYDIFSLISNDSVPLGVKGFTGFNAT
jgi:hypothetical protein